MDTLAVELLHLIMYENIAIGQHGVLRLVCRLWKEVIDSTPRPRNSPLHNLSIQYMCGTPAMIQWAYVYRCPWTTGTAAAITKMGNRETLEWALTHHCPVDKQGTIAAIQLGDIDKLALVVKWGGVGVIPREIYETILQAGFSEAKEIAMIQWVRARGHSWDDWLCYFAAKNMHLGVVHWARSEGCLWNQWAEDAAIAVGYRESDECYYNKKMGYVIRDGKRKALEMF
jgi:hypothetical protein